MTKKLVTIGPEDLVVYGAKLLSEEGFNGLPVIDEQKNLVGILTEYDLISQGNSIHLPTLINILGNIDVYKKDKGLVKDDLKNLLSLKVKDVMNREPITIEEDAWIQEISDLFTHHHRVNPIPVMDSNKKLVGIVSRFDLIKLFAGEETHRNNEIAEPENLDKSIESFMNHFEKRFVLVSKNRAKYFWPIVSLSFAAIGFIIAFSLILRIVSK
mgnify:CR=1 FL=1